MNPDITPFVAPLAALQQVIDHFNRQGMIIGGIAASLLGQPRLTADVDAVLLLPVKKLFELLEVAAQAGLAPRLADAETFARQNRVLLLVHEDSQINVDISLGMLPFEVEAIGRAIEYNLGQISLRLPTPEDLIILKAVAHRPKDIEDIKAIIAIQSNLDKQRIEHWVTQFAEILEMPELWDDIARLL
jgi:predicted nucleotidyltransferase